MVDNRNGNGVTSHNAILFYSHNGSHMGSVCQPVFLHDVRLSVFPHDISKTDAARITQLDIQKFHDQSWKPVYSGVKRSKVTSHKNSAGMGRCTLVSTGFLHFLPFSVFV